MSISLPDSVCRLLGDVPLSADAMGRSRAQVFRAGNTFVKMDAEGALKRSADMQEYFFQKGLSGRLIGYIQENGWDYLLTEALCGKCACDESLLRNPQRLAGRLGEAVRMLHETSAADCPITDVNEQAIALYAREHGGVVPEHARFLKKDALVHGDCCLPNLFFHENAFEGFIDLGESGLGDSHFDLYWATWSLGYNLKSDRYADDFLDAYGRERVDADRMALCALLSRE